MGKCVHNLESENTTLKIVKKRVLVYPQVYDCFCEECHKTIKFKLDDKGKFHRVIKRSSNSKTEKEETTNNE